MMCAGDDDAEVEDGVTLKGQKETMVAGCNAMSVSLALSVMSGWLRWKEDGSSCDAVAAFLSSEARRRMSRLARRPEIHILPRNFYSTRRLLSHF